MVKRTGSRRKVRLARDAKSFDAVVVGAGAIGLACAWRAAQRGLRVALVDREAPGSGATRVAAGMLAPLGEASWGEDALLELNFASARMYPDFAAELAEVSGEAVGYRRVGALHVALDRDEAEELRRRHELHVALGLDARWVRPRECREIEPGLAPAVTGGVHARHEGEVDPGSLVAALVRALEHEGVELVFGEEAADALIEGERLVGVRTRAGRELRAAHTVLATGWSAGRTPWLPAHARPPVRPVKGQVLTLRGSPDEPLCEGIVATEWVYVVPRADGRVIVGATVEERGADTTVTAGGVHELLRESYRVLPDVAELELAGARAGLRPATPDNAPAIGPGALDGLILATGHFRNGILLAPVTGDAVAGLLAGDRPPEVIAPLGAERFEGVASR
jgi:glycine oxidase